MSYLNILPNEIIYVIIKNLNDRNLINKLIHSTKYLIETFNNDDIWKEIFFINIAALRAACDQ